MLGVGSMRTVNKITECGVVNFVNRISFVYYYLWCVCREGSLQIAKELELVRIRCI
jgi:hypothetical protein